MVDIQGVLKKIYWKIDGTFFDLLTVFSPRLNTKLRYRRINHMRLDLRNPESFSEKLLKIKLENYDNNELVRICADKMRVRQYLTNLDLDSVLIPLIGCYKTTEEIEWDQLPQRFVIKLNVGCGFNYICTNKKNEDKGSVLKTINRWIKEAPKYYKHASEMQYKNVPIWIMIEEYIGDSTVLLPEDYKFYCFNGFVKAVLYIYGRETKEQSAVFFDTEWNYLGETGKSVYKTPSYIPEKPVNFGEMVKIAELLCKPFPFIRVDLYNIQGKIYFGELTFTPAGGLQPAECKINGNSMGELLRIE